VTSIPVAVAVVCLLSGRAGRGLLYTWMVNGSKCDVPRVPWHVVLRGLDVVNFGSNGSYASNGTRGTKMRDERFHASLIVMVS
jgi:hypothetical protein